MYSVQTSNDYFSAAFNINSYDNNGTPLMVMTHTQGLNGGPSNAAANHAPQPMTLGDGVSGQCTPMVSLDIIAHEYTHGVLNNYIILNQDLVTTTALQFSTKAIQEALSDIFSVIIRHNESGEQNTWNNQSIWTVGAEACTNHPEVPRFIDAPQNSVSIQASYYQDPVYNWSNNQMDYYNRAGVISYWFYLLSTGQQGVNGDVIKQALGINGSEDVVITALNLMRADIGVTQYSFEAFRDFTVQAAINLHGICSNEHRSVVEAWIAVGLFDCANINITFEENDPTPADPCDKELTAKVNNGSGCYTFEWFEIDNGNPINLNLTTQTIPVVCNKVYRVKVTDTHLGTVVQPCEHEDNHSVFATNTRKVEELNLDVTIRPTLANNQIFFDLEVEEPTTITISIFDQLGRRISQPIVSEKVYQGNRTIQHNVENLASGIYFVSIETPKGKIVKKFVKM